MRTPALLACLLLLTASLPLVAGHAERDASFPSGEGEVPVYREEGPYLLTCKPDTLERLRGMAGIDHAAYALQWLQCQQRGYEHLQAAVDAVPEAGTRILMMPGVYKEEPSVERLTSPSETCLPLVDQSILSYEEHVACPNIQNLVAILGDDPEDEDDACIDERLCRLQIEGTGRVPEDVILDGDWNHLNALRADRADGIILKNFLVQRTEFNAVYILETDGFLIEDHKTRWNYEYGYLTYVVDHGLIQRCESYGNGDSGVYPGSASDLFGARASVEIRHCELHHNALGYSGTAGNSVNFHHNNVHNNTAGISTDSLFPNHPGMPQDSAVFHKNRIHGNNINYHDNWLPDGPCHKPLRERGIEEGVVCPVVPVPVGTGILIAGGNANRISENWIYDNWRYGTMLFGVPSYFRGHNAGLDLFCLLASQNSGCVEPSPADLQGDAATQFDTSHENRYLGNSMGIAPSGAQLPNGQDHWWDEQGRGNCWQSNLYIGEGPRPGPDPVHNPAMFPVCGVNDALEVSDPPHARLATIVPCNDHEEPDNTHPEGCDWMDDPEKPT